MFIGFYILLSLIIAGAVYFNRNKTVNNCLLYLFAALQCSLCAERFFAADSVQLQFFTNDSIAKLLLIVLSILNITSIFYSLIYLEKRGDPPKVRSMVLNNTNCLVVIDEEKRNVAKGDWVKCIKI